MRSSPTLIFRCFVLISATSARWYTPSPAPKPSTPPSAPTSIGCTSYEDLAAGHRDSGLSKQAAKCDCSAWRTDDKVGINVVAYQPGAENTKPALRELAERTLAEFDLIGEID